MNINKMITPYNRTISRNKENKYIVIHYTGNNGDTAKGNCNYFMQQLPDNKKASANYFVDENEIWQCVDDGNVAWHVGSSKYIHPDCRNGNSIGIEMCSKKKGNKYYIEDKTIRNAQELVATLMEKYNITSDRVIMHYDVTGKICPKPFVEDPIQWVNFKAKLLWVDDLINLKKNGRVNSAPMWVRKVFEIDEEIKYIFIGWNKELKK